MKIKNNHTNIIGYLILLFIVASLGLLLLGKITIEQAGTFIVFAIGILTGIGFLKSADAKNLNNQNNPNDGK